MRWLGLSSDEIKLPDLGVEPIALYSNKSKSSLIFRKSVLKQIKLSFSFKRNDWRLWICYLFGLIEVTRAATKESFFPHNYGVALDGTGSGCSKYYHFWCRP